MDYYVPVASLKALAIVLMNQYIKFHEQNMKKEWVNDIVRKIKQELKIKTNTSYPEDIDFYKTLLEKRKVEKFDQVVSSLKIIREIERREIRGFRIVASTRPYSNASQMKEKSGRKMAFTTPYKYYNEPYRFLKSLKEIELAETEYYKYFVDFDYKTLNKYGFPVSGGERSEFNLLHEISDALKHDLLLLDEPESSFDNLFLKNEVNELIKDIAQSIPVIVVTHNSTVGASIKPDYILYTERSLTAKGVEYVTYSGHPSDKVLISVDGKTISNFKVMLNCLEAGSETYNERRTKSYEILKNQ
jgi:ABC-type oligopeptide transport system ATPase subunit